MVWEPGTTLAGGRRQGLMHDADVEAGQKHARVVRCVSRAVMAYAPFKSSSRSRVLAFSRGRGFLLVCSCVPLFAGAVGARSPLASMFASVSVSVSASA